MDCIHGVAESDTTEQFSLSLFTLGETAKTQNQGLKPSRNPFLANGQSGSLPVTRPISAPGASQSHCNQAARAWGGGSDGRMGCEVLQRSPAVERGTATHTHGPHLQEARGMLVPRWTATSCFDAEGYLRRRRKEQPCWTPAIPLC